MRGTYSRRIFCLKRSRISTQKVVKILSLLEDGFVVPGKYIAKGPKKRLEVLKNELDETAIKLNYMKLDIGMIMQKIFLRTCNQWVVSFD